MKSYDVVFENGHGALQFEATYEVESLEALAPLVLADEEECRRRLSRSVELDAMGYDDATSVQGFIKDGTGEHDIDYPLTERLCDLIDLIDPKVD